VFLFQRLQQPIRGRLARCAELLDPFRQDMRIAKCPEPLKRAPSQFPHGLPIAYWIEVHHYIGNENASTQGDAQVVD
jgi:hypothetical protein